MALHFIVKQMTKCEPSKEYQNSKTRQNQTNFVTSKTYVHANSQRLK